MVNVKFIPLIETKEQELGNIQWMVEHIDNIPYHFIVLQNSGGTLEVDHPLVIPVGLGCGYSSFKECIKPILASFLELEFQVRSMEKEIPNLSTVIVFYPSAGEDDNWDLGIYKKSLVDSSLVIDLLNELRIKMPEYLRGESRKWVTERYSDLMDFSHLDRTDLEETGFEIVDDILVS